MFLDEECMCREALRVAKKHTSSRVADVAFLNDTATQCAPPVSNAVVDDNEPSLARNPARDGKSRTGPHVYLSHAERYYAWPPPAANLYDTKIVGAKLSNFMDSSSLSTATFTALSSSK
jgi:hypothetical protein